MFFNLFRRKPQDEAYLAVDIGTETVKAAVFMIEEKHGVTGEVIGKRAVIKGFGKINHKAGEGALLDIANTLASSQEAIAAASREAQRKPSRLVLGIAGEFIKGSTSTESYSREDHEAKINLSELRNIVHKLEWRAFAESRRKLSEETGYSEIDIKLIHTAVVDVRIDGYKVTNPLGFQGKKVDMSIFNAFAPLTHHGAIHNIAEELGVELLGIISEPYALSHSLEGAEGNLSAILVDVGGGTTDIAVISNGCVVGSRMFAIGGRTFTKRLAVELNISIAEAEKLKFSYTADKLEQKSRKIISDIIESDTEIWLEGVELALSEFRQIEVLPSKILLSGGGAYLPEIKNALNNEKWHKKLHFAHAPQAQFMRPSDIPAVIDETKKIKEREDIMPMALVNAGIELSGEENVMQKTLQKVIGIMKV
ncbi:rod shape-determining protein [Candidatus Peregrinibacteria bacterium]|nr:rod shape-determining protein [Candidatus Peregrinibacteria bacterium]